VISFTPSASGARAASLTITDNASGGPQSVALSGTGTHDVILTWTASPTSPIAGYDIYRGTASGGESSTPLNSSPVSGITFADENVQAGTTYYYVVTTVSSVGSRQSADSNEASAKVPSP
jgi:fibronectin type 3 domain-containing protein